MAKKVAVITGGSSGIGRAAAVRLAQEGYHLVIAGRSHQGLDETKKRCVAAGIPREYVHTVTGDICLEETSTRILHECIQKFGQLDALVNSAGILTLGKLTDASISVYDQQFEVNVRSVVQITRLAIPHLLHTKGCVVNVSSTCGKNVIDSLGYYCMSKAALDQYTKALALELAPKGVRVNAVCPGVIRTELHQRAGVDDGSYEQTMTKFEQQHAMNRLGELEEAADAINFLVTGASSFVTGHLLYVDGGFGLVRPQ